MADNLRKIERAGTTRPLQYAVRDVRGVESPAADPAERTGFNEEAEWTERSDAAINCEHDADGNHGGYKFLRAVVILVRTRNPDGTETWTIDGESWREGTTQSAASFVSLAGEVLTFTKAWGPTAAVQYEGMGSLAVKFSSATELGLDRSRCADPDKTGGCHALAIYEAT